MYKLIDRYIYNTDFSDKINEVYYIRFVFYCYLWFIYDIHCFFQDACTVCCYMYYYSVDVTRADEAMYIDKKQFKEKYGSYR